MRGPQPASRPVTAEAAAIARRLDCTNANACLAIAEAKGWPALTCNDCDDGYVAPDEAQRLRDLGGLMAIQGLAGIGSEDSDDDEDTTVITAARVAARSKG
jgi:hypothetical protein